MFTRVPDKCPLRDKNARDQVFPYIFKKSVYIGMTKQDLLFHHTFIMLGTFI